MSNALLNLNLTFSLQHMLIYHGFRPNSKRSILFVDFHNHTAVSLNITNVFRDSGIIKVQNKDEQRNNDDQERFDFRLVDSEHFGTTADRASDFADRWRMSRRKNLLT